VVRDDPLSLAQYALSRQEWISWMTDGIRAVERGGGGVGQSVRKGESG